MADLTTVRAIAAKLDPAPDVVASDGHVWLLFPGETGASAADAREHYGSALAAQTALLQTLEGRVNRARTNVEFAESLGFATEDEIARMRDALADAGRRLDEARAIAAGGAP